MSLHRKPQSLDAEFNRIFKQAESILDRADNEGRELTDAETKEYDELLRKLKSTGQLKKLAALDTTSKPGDEPLFPGDGPRITAMSGGTVKAFANTRDGKQDAYKSGRFLMATLLGDEGSRTWCRDAGMDIDKSIRMAHSAGVNTSGGVLVPEELSSTIIRLVEEYGVFRRLVRTVPMGSDTLNIPRRAGGLTAYYTGEGVAGTESDTAWDNVALVAKKLMVLTRMSSEISEDSIISMADMLAMEATQAFALKEDTVGFLGTGISTDGGITGVNVKAIDGSHGLASVEAVAPHNLLTEIDSTDIINLMAAVPSFAKRGSSFVCSPAAMDVVFNSLKIASGGNSLENLQNMVKPSFLGYPIEVTDIYPDDVTEDLDAAVMIGFGNLSQACTLGSRREVRMALSNDVYFAEDQVAIKGTLRHDINVHDLGSGTVKSPFCVLVGNAS